MEIKKVTFNMGNDFAAIMVCEHCESTQELNSGYNDDNYHCRVIPAMTCKSCGKNRAGEVPVVKNDNGFIHVPA